MNNFGVIELASTKTTHAPGWAYVPDTAPHLAAAAAAAASLQTGNRKRAARNQAASTSALYADADARQEAKLRREIEALDRDNYHRDVSIPITAKSTKAAVKKHTPNVRKILQSQKTFANHLDDFDALLAQDKANPNATATSAGGGGTGSAATTTASGSKKGGAAAEKNQHKHKKSSKSTSSRAASSSKGTPAVKQEDDIEMPDAPDHPPTTNTTTPAAAGTEDPSSAPPRSAILTPYTRPINPHPQDANPLLVSRVPPLPSDEELRALLRAPPLTYAEARGRWATEEEDEAGGGGGGGTRRYPTRTFCGVCGYWGRVRCMRCGARACALECLETHREECVSRYGI